VSWPICLQFARELCNNYLEEGEEAGLGKKSPPTDFPIPSSLLVGVLPPEQTSLQMTLTYVEVSFD